MKLKKFNDFLTEKYNTLSENNLSYITGGEFISGTNLEDVLDEIGGTYEEDVRVQDTFERGTRVIEFLIIINKWYLHTTGKSIGKGSTGKYFKKYMDEYEKSIEQHLDDEDWYDDSNEAFEVSFVLKMDGRKATLELVGNIDEVNTKRTVFDKVSANVEGTSDEEALKFLEENLPKMAKKHGIL
jgi:hypothetical protein